MSDCKRGLLHLMTLIWTDSAGVCKQGRFVSNTTCHDNFLHLNSLADYTCKFQVLEVGLNSALLKYPVIMFSVNTRTLRLQEDLLEKSPWILD